jgi:hypothetical protein
LDNTGLLDLAKGAGVVAATMPISHVSRVVAEADLVCSGFSDSITSFNSIFVRADAGICVKNIEPSSPALCAFSVLAS